MVGRTETADSSVGPRLMAKHTGVVRKKTAFYSGLSATATFAGKEFAIFAPDTQTLELLWLMVMRIPLDKAKVQQVIVGPKARLTILK